MIHCLIFLYRYRIQQGSFDDFIIDNKSGLITIGRKLDYDRRNTYQIEIVAADLGMCISFINVPIVFQLINNHIRTKV